VFRVESGLSTAHFPLGQWTVYFTCKLFCFCFVLFCFERGEGGRCQSKQKISQVPDNKESPLAPHVSPIWFGKCFPPFTYLVGPKGTNFKPQNKTSIASLFLNDGQIKLFHCKKKNLGGTSSNEWER